MIIAIHQPMYLPWMGFFEKLLKADLFVLLDDVQFEKNGWQNRNRIKGPQGAQWLTVPVYQRFGQRICDVTVPQAVPWASKHYRTLQQYYGHAPCWPRYAEPLRELYSRTYTRLFDVTTAFFAFVYRALGATCRVAYTSQLDLHIQPPAGVEMKSYRLVALAQHFQATHYYSGGGADYLDEAAFRAHGIEVIRQEFMHCHPRYSQQYAGQGFLPCLSIIDALLNCGAEMTRELILTASSPVVVAS